MDLKSLLGLLKKSESLVSLDIGSTGIKLIEFDMRSAKPLLLNVGVAPVSPDIFNGHALAQVERVAEQISGLLESNGIMGKRVVLSLPGPSVITKRVRLPKQSYADLSSTIQYEASNFIPLNIDSVRLDFAVLGEAPNDELDVLVVAARNEVIDSFLEAVALVGLEAAVVDVDIFALQNMFELSQPADKEKTVALLNMGARFTGVTICRSGVPLFNGDLSIGGKQFTEAIADEMKVSEEQAEKLKRNVAKGGDDNARVREVLDQKVEAVAAEISRQLGFFWNASGADGAIEKVLLTGGGSLTAGLIEEVSVKTGLPCERLNPFAGIDCGNSIEQQVLDECAPLMGVSVGLGIRQPGDRDVGLME